MRGTPIRLVFCNPDRWRPIFWQQRGDERHSYKFVFCDLDRWKPKFWQQRGLWVQHEQPM